MDITEQELHLQILSLKHQQTMQQALLAEQFEQQQDALLQQQRIQMQEHVTLQYIMMQKERRKHQEQQRIDHERMEEERLAQLKNKKDEEKSANASSEVKLRLQEHLLNKKRVETGATKITHSPPLFRHGPWPQSHSLEQHSPPQSELSPPFRPHLLGESDEDYPLRKTASEPNLKLVRSRLKQKVIQRSSPLLRRRDVTHIKRKHPLTIDTTLAGSNPDSGPNSPPSSGSQKSCGEPSTTPAKEEPGTFPLQLMSKMVNLSMPNIHDISVGRPRNKDNGSPDHVTHHTSISLNEAELSALAYRQNMSMAGHILPTNIPFYPTLPVIEGEFSDPASPVQIGTHMKVLEPGVSPVITGAYMVPVQNTGISDGHVPQSKVNRHGRPLYRTQSAPLPIPVQHSLQQQQQLMKEQMSKENQTVKQRLQATVLQRTKYNMENVDEETEAKIAQEMKEMKEDDDVLIVNHYQEPDIGTNNAIPTAVEEGTLQPRDLLMLKFRHQSSLGSLSQTQRPPLVRARSSPSVVPGVQNSSSAISPEVKFRFTTGIAYDPQMLKHQCVCGNNGAHPEHPGRLQSISSRLHATGLFNLCEKVPCRKATIEELQTCHSGPYTLLYGTSSLNRQKLDVKIFENLPSRFCVLPCGGFGVDSDTVWNDQHTPCVARMATGCVIELACQVAMGNLKNGIALVRPPGHHAERDRAMGFCYFNSVAIAAKILHDRFKQEKILIFDWDVHHGNSTQQMFYSNPNVLYISIHRHDNGNFFPGTGAPEECGADDGVGFNVNVAFHGALSPPMGDAEYLAAFRTIVMPIAREFNPDIVLVSAGFDAMSGHPSPLGGYLLSAMCFGHMTQQLMSLANGKLVLVLEGGYDLPGICDASETCVRALLGEKLPDFKKEELVRTPSPVAVEALEKVVGYQMMHWPCLKRYNGCLSMSALEARRLEREEADTVTALASLSMVQERQQSKEEEPQPEPMEES